MFVARPAAAEGTVSIVPRNPCPDQARVTPGSQLGVEVQAILNPRIGRLQCEAGKARCDATDVNPGALLRTIPQVVENVEVHTYTDRCDPAGDWVEFMMFAMGEHAIGESEPFQVRGTQGEATAVRYDQARDRTHAGHHPASQTLTPRRPVILLTERSNAHATTQRALRGAGERRFAA